MVRQEDVIRPLDVFPESMNCVGSLDRRDDMRTIHLYLSGGKLFEISEPVTDRMAITALREYYGELVPGAMADLQNDVRNECRAQIVPGYDSNLLAATMIIKAMPIGRAMQLPNSQLMQWIGDQAGTLERALHTRVDLQDLWGLRPLGWRVPESFHDEKGMLRKRALRCTNPLTLTPPSPSNPNPTCM